MGVEEAFPQGSQLEEALAAGVITLSQQQEITFTKYVRVVLPLDGFVFWVKADMLSPSAAFGSMAYDVETFNESGTIIIPAPTLVARGSLHYVSETNQKEDAVYAVNTVIFTSLDPVEDFNQVSPTVLFIAEFEGVKFAFSKRQSFYRQAKLYHYVGQAVYSTMETQVIDDPAQLNLRDVVVSNSLPAWLALNNYQRSYAGSIVNPPISLYPSFAVPDNLAPPFAAVHILPETTRSLQSAPYLDSSLSHSQLTTEKVRLSFYGVRNARAMDFIDAVNQYTLDTEAFGLMNMPTMRDEKVTQNELSTLAMKKVADYEVNYYQSTMRGISRQLIKHAIVNYIIKDHP